VTVTASLISIHVKKRLPTLVEKNNLPIQRTQFYW